MAHDISPVVHILEVGGQGGVYQHTLAVAVALQEQQRTVVVHTSTEPEIEDDRLTYCKCFDWKRNSTRFRAFRIFVHFVIYTLPHFASFTGVSWIQGTFKVPMTFLAIGFLKYRKRFVLFSPHNLFSRNGGKLDQYLLKKSLSLVDRVIAYNSHDFARLQLRHIPSKQMPLLMYKPHIGDETIEYWRQEIERTGAKVCSIGQLRPDKNLGLLVDAAHEAQVPLLLMGADKGAIGDIKEHAAKWPGNNTSIYEGYFPLADLAAVIGLTGVVALPYSIASQSGVAALAQAYGAKVLAYDTGGLREQADVVVEDLSVRSWAEAIGAACGHVRPRTLESEKLNYSDSEMEALSRAIETIIK